MENGIIELRIRGVSMEDDDPIVILEDRATDRRLLLPIGPFEASAILLEMEGIRPPRPLTHDLLAEFFEEGGFCLDEAEFYGEAGASVRARLSYRKGLRKYVKEVRPSDALALALRLSAPLRAEASLLELQERGCLPWQRPRILAMDRWKAKALRA
jgi:bifunctional DNase/RNase